jgi:hypothetical protein
MQSLNMLTLMEGKERTLTEYEVLLKRAGFGEVRGCRNTTPLDAVLALKACLGDAQLSSITGQYIGLVPTEVLPVAKGAEQVFGR